MVKKHLKALAAPKSWRINRKDRVFVTKPRPGSHGYNLSFSINHILKNELGICNITKEVKQILNKGECMVNQKIVKDVHYNTGFMDVVSLPRLNKHYRIVLDSKGYLTLVEINEKESNLILSKIINKKILKGKKIQLNTMDGKNIIVDKDSYKTSGSLLFEVPSQKIIKSIPLEEGCSVVLLAGKHKGTIATIEKIEEDKVIFNRNNQSFQTLKRFVFVLGKSKSEIKVSG